MTNDIGGLFESMRTAYGPQWKHRQEAMQVWLKVLKNHDPEAIRNAMTAVLKTHLDYPPTLSQFLQIVEGPKERITTCLPPASFDKVNHATAMREMRRSKDMPAYKLIGKSSSNGGSAGKAGQEKGTSQNDCPCCGRKGCERCQCPPIEEDYDGPLNEVTL